MAEGSFSANEGADLSKYGQICDQVLKRYELRKHLGSGAFGDVIEALHLSTNTLMAMKLLRYDPTKVKDDATKETLNISKAGYHNNIVVVYDNFRFSPTHHAITMERFDMDLSEYFRPKRNRVIRLMLEVSLQSVTGLAFLHELQPPLIHRDIKPQNILIKIIKINAHTIQVVAKLSDFGISNIPSVADMAIPAEISKTLRNMVTTVAGRGTKAFLAPEFFAARDGRGLENGKFRIEPSVDIFALGLVYLYVFFHNNSDYGKLNCLCFGMSQEHTDCGARKGYPPPSDCLRRVLMRLNGLN